MMQNLKIVTVIIFSLILAIFIGNKFFLANSPRLNKSFIASLFSKKITPTPTLIPKEIIQPLEPAPTIISANLPSATPVIPTTKPTIQQPKGGLTISPTLAVSITCPTSSTQSYDTIQTQSDYVISGPPDQHPEVNLGLRSYTQVNEKPELVNYGGDTDPQALKINSLFADARVPTIIYTYKVNAWDYSTNSRSLQTENAWPVSLIGLVAESGEPLVVPPSGREIGSGNELMVIYAEANRITFTNSVGDNWTDGYILHVEDICTDPNLIAAYRSADAAGRGSLPALPRGKVFGTARSGEVKVAIRDSGQFMDPRSKKDWW